VRNGTLALGTVALGDGDVFSQQDIDRGLVSYSHDDSETDTDRFEFVLSDGVFASSGTFNISITLLNDNSATSISNLQTGDGLVPENAGPGTPSGITAFAFDEDTGDVITYTLIDNDGGRFTIDTSSGVVVVAGLIDYESDGDVRTITVRASSSDGSHSDQVFTIRIGDVDDSSVIDMPFDAPVHTSSEQTGTPKGDLTAYEAGLQRKPDPVEFEVGETVPVQAEPKKTSGTVSVHSQVFSNVEPVNNASVGTERQKVPLLLLEEDFGGLSQEDLVQRTEWVRLPLTQDALENLNREALEQAIDQVRSDIQQDQDDVVRTFKKLSAGTSLGLSVGYVSWLLRGGALMGAFMSSLTVWQTYDPLFVIIGKKRKDREEKMVRSKADALFDRAAGKHVVTGL
jgi:hypothetical protein